MMMMLLFGGGVSCCTHGSSNKWHGVKGNVVEVDIYIYVYV